MEFKKFSNIYEFFFIYINDLDLVFSSKVSKFADNTKLEIGAADP